MITQKLKKLVVKEALMLRKYATKQEKDRLSSGAINAFDTKCCVYGLMTGDCDSSRAIGLLNKCTKPYSGNHRHFESTECKRFLNRDIGCQLMYSPIEYYITQEGAKIDDLVNLIKS